MTKKSKLTPHEEFLHSDEKANELFDFVCEELAAINKGSSTRHHKFYIARRAHNSLETYYFACTLLEVFEKTPITKIDFDFSEEYDDNGGNYLSTSAELFYVLKNSDGSFTEEKSCTLYSSDIEEMDGQELCDSLNENHEAVDIVSQIGNTMNEWGLGEVDNFHETLFEKHNVMTAYSKNHPEIYPLIEKFILSNFVDKAAEKAPKRSQSKM